MDILDKLYSDSKATLAFVSKFDCPNCGNRWLVTTVKPIHGVSPYDKCPFCKYDPSKDKKKLEINDLLKI